MSEQNRYPECKTILQLLPEFALGSLDSADADSVRQHVTLCQPCRRELNSYHNVADALLLTPEPIAPSQSLRRRTLMAAGIVAPSESAARATTGEGILRRLSRLISPQLVVNRLSPAIALVALAVALGFGYQANQLQAELDNMRMANLSLETELARQDQAVSEVLNPGALVWELRGTESAPTAKATLYCNKNSQTAILAAADLPPLPESQVYQLWLIHDGRRTNGGLLVVDSKGKGVLTVRAPEPFSTYQAVGLTVEPTGGSEGPTGPRVLGGQLY